MNFHIITFGCKVNQCESEDIHTAMLDAGFLFSNDTDKADIVIINSCAVTAESTRKLRQAIHKIKRANPASIIVLMGCVPQAEPNVASNIIEADIIVGNIGKFNVPNIIKDYLESKRRIICVKNINSVINFENSPVNCNQRRSRAFLKIEDGCNRFCSYCIIPYARGRVRSKSLSDIQKDATLLVENGFKEIVLVGINLSSYGIDLNLGLDDAVVRVAASGVKRVRLGSLEPDLMSDGLIEKLKAIPSFCPQFHLSLQSGSNDILRSMRRHYSRDDYIALVQKLRKSFSGATFTTDIIVGFPGETDENFEDTLKIIEEVQFLKVHVFPYSPRLGTLAEKMPNQISKKLKSQRVKKVIEISEKVSSMVIGSFIGQCVNVLYETCDSSGFYKGFTEGYIPVRTRSDKDICGKIVKTRIMDFENNFCQGLIV